MRIFGFTIMRKMPAEQRLRFVELRLQLLLVAAQEDLDRQNRIMMDALRKLPADYTAISRSSYADGRVKGLKQALEALNTFFME